MSSLVFFGHPESVHSYKVALALSVLERRYEYRWVFIGGLVTATLLTLYLLPVVYGYLRAPRSVR